MSQPRRRRRRRRKANNGSAGDEPSGGTNAETVASKVARPGRNRRRRGTRGAGGRKPPTPQTLEDVVRDIRGTPERLTAPADGQRLEEVIGELQSVWGVPQYPQEYRITVKVAEERMPVIDREVKEGPNGVQRERAPAAPRVGPAPSGEGGVKRERAPRRRRRVRRGRRRRDEGG